VREEKVELAEQPLPGASPDDMNDSAEILEYDSRSEASRLVRVLTCVADTVVPSFREAEREVARRKKAYFRFARCAAWLGASAVFFAILQLSELGRNLLPPALLTWLEFGLAATAVAVSLVGLGGRKQQKWFLARHRAEQLRLLKFNFLTRSAVWSPDRDIADSCFQGLAAEVEAVMASSFPALEHWVLCGSVPQVISAPAMPDSELRELSAYYRKKRLMAQITYLRNASQKNVARDEKTRSWPSVLFFGSVAFVLAHFCVELVAWRTGGELDTAVGKAALLLAATLPAWGAGVRVIRGVLEYARNASRYESNHNVLLKLSERLREASDSTTVFREIGFCEQTMEADLREWLRLMVEAEWFG
jgi:hypothetical protein